jgi:hypothetical protein
MNKKFVIILIILVIFAVIYGSLTGIPVSSEVKEDECRAGYKRYLFPKHLCQFITSGHCATTDFNKYNAEMEVAHCLCSKYLSDPSNETKNQILQKCDLVKPDCHSSVERIKTDYCNETGLNSLECRDHFSKNDTQDIDFICQNKEQIFYKIFID